MSRRSSRLLAEGGKINVQHGGNLGVALTDGYLTKDAGGAEVLAAVRKIHGGGKYVSASLGERLALDVEVDDALERPSHEKLSHREFQVMQLIGAGKTLSAIAAELGLSIKTVSTYRARILDKMEMKSAPDQARLGLDQDHQEHSATPPAELRSGTWHSASGTRQIKKGASDHGTARGRAEGDRMGRMPH